jgi:benzoyl-CoA reductase subunit D
VVLVTGGLASDAGLLAAIQDALDEDGRVAGTLRVAGHPLSIFAGAIGAAIWGAFRHEKTDLGGAAWKATTPTTRASSSAT